MLADREDKESGNRKAARFFKNVGRISGRERGWCLPVFVPVPQWDEDKKGVG